MPAEGINANIGIQKDRGARKGELCRVLAAAVSELALHSDAKPNEPEA